MADSVASTSTDNPDRETFFGRAVYLESPHYVMITDSEGVISECNQVSLDVFGEDIVGRNLTVVIPDLTPAHIAHLRVGQSQSIRPAKLEGSRPITIVRLGSGAIVVYEECFGRRDGSCQALGQESAIVRKILSSIPQHVFWKDRDSVYLGCNENFAKVAGVETPEDIVGKTDYDLAWTKEESDWYRQCDREVMDKGTGMLNIEELQTREDGTITNVLTSKVPLKDMAGNVIGILGLYADVTDMKQAELRVRDSEARFNELFTSVREGIGLIDVNEVVEYCNPAFAHFFDAGSPGELIGRNIVEFFPEDQRSIMRHQSSLRRVGATTQYEVRYDRVNGAPRYLHLTVSPRFNDAGTFIGSFGALLDITDRKRAEMALHSNLKFLETLLDTIPSPVYYENTEGICLGCNSAFSEQIAGRHREDVVGKHLKEIAGNLDDLVAPTRAGGDMLVGHECRIQYTDGKHHDVVLSLDRFGDAHGNAAGSVGVITDVGDMKAVETRLNDIVRQYTTMINTVPAALYVKDAQYRYTIVNEGFRTMAIRGRSDAIGRNDSDLFDPELASELRKQDASVLHHGKPIHQSDSSFLQPDGSRRWYSTTKVPLLDADGQAIGVVGMTQDITDTHIAREKLIQADKLAAIGTLAAGVAHEINNPIGFVRSNLNTMSKYLAKIRRVLGAATLEGDSERESIIEMLDDFTDAIAESIDGTTRVKNIVADLKSFSRVDRAEKAYANINDGLDSTLNIVWNELKYKCKVEREYGNLPDLFCVPNQLNQVFMNLLLNAGHAIETEGTIRIRTWTDDDGIWVSIKDDGKGIPQEIQSRIFEPFFTTKPVGKGTGLGLSLAFDIIEKHGGTIEVHSEVGQGAEFRIRLPHPGVSDD